VIAENLLLKHQLQIVARSRRRAPNLVATDRFFLGFWSLFLRPGRMHKSAVILRPSTLLQFHQYLVRRKYRLLFSSRTRTKPGPKGPSKQVIHAVVELKRRNPDFGCPRIALIVSKTFGVNIDKNVVRRILAVHYHYRPGSGGPSWLTFLGHAKDSLWSVDLFRCESIILNSYWVLVVMAQFTRCIIGFAVHAGDVNGMVLCRIFNKVIAGNSPPRHLSTDNDPLFLYHRWQANLRILEIDEIKSVPGVPISHPFIERLIGTVRREFLDHIFFWNTVDLESKLREFQHYYNQERVHASLGGETPIQVGGKSRKQNAECRSRGIYLGNTLSRTCPIAIGSVSWNSRPTRFVTT
jgi:transposase InsO family protein